MISYLRKEIPRVGARIIHTMHGLHRTWKDEPSFAQWVVINIISIVLTFVVPMSGTEQLILIILGLLILVIELLNTGIEAAIDRISPDIHDLSKKAKDAGCAAVALMALIGLFAWIWIFVT